MAAYRALPPRGGKPQTRSNSRCAHLTRYEWTVLAGLVLLFEDKYIPIALATGVKCQPFCRISPHGDVLHDSHAEVLARRAARAWLLERISAESQQEFGDIPPIFCRTNSRWRLSDSASLHWYVSTLPCGNASAHLFRNGDESVNFTGGLRRGRDDVRTDALLRTKPGRRDAPASISMSCSDKMCMWNTLGIQGAIMSHWVEPIRVKSLTICNGDAGALEACRNAIFRRVGGPPIAVHSTRVEYAHSLDRVQAHVESETGIQRDSPEWPDVEPVSCAASIIWRRGSKSENILGGVRQGAARGRNEVLPCSAWCVATYLVVCV